MDLQTFDAEYVRALVEGDPEVERHFARYFSDLISIKLRARRLPEPLIDDLRQETFLRAISALRRGALERAEKLGSFVNSICNNVLLEHYRVRTHASLEHDVDEEPQDRAPTVESHLVEAQRKAMVLRVLGELNQKDQSVLRMVVLEERDKSEVCRDLQVNREHLRVLLHRAKLRFKELLLREGGDSWNGPGKARQAGG